MIITPLVILGVVAAVAVLTLQHPAFGRFPEGARQERIKQSPNYRDGQFHNVQPTVTMTSESGLLSNLWKFVFGKKNEDLKPKQPLPVVKTDLRKLSRKDDCVVWFGHSSYLLQMNAVRFLVDPVLTNEFPVSLMLSPFEGTDCYTPDDIPDVDYLIITHDHWDHLDYATVKRLRDRVNRVICPLGVGADFEYWGYEASKIVEMDWNETFEASADMKIHCLPSRHFSGRLLKSNPTLWAAFLIEGSRRVFLSGDGGYGKQFAEIGQRFGTIDLAIMENGQYNGDWKNIHTMPHELPHEITELRARKALTVHHSRFALSRHSWHEPMDSIRINSAGKPYELLAPAIGEVQKF